MKAENSENSVRIRSAAPDDAEALLRIYAPYVLKTGVTFEYEVPSEENFRARIEGVLEKYPYLVACDGERIVAVNGHLGIIALEKPDRLSFI